MLQQASSSYTLTPRIAHCTVWWCLLGAAAYTLTPPIAHFAVWWCLLGAAVLPTRVLLQAS